MAVTRMSTKGQLIIPKAVRDGMGAAAGTEFTVEIDRGSIRLTPRIGYKARVARTTLDDVAGCLSYDGPAVTKEAMRSTLRARATARFKRSAA